MTWVVAGVLLVLATLDAVFAGFRASVGRTGLIDHRDADRRAAVRGLGLLALMLPAVVVVLGDLALAGRARPERMAVFRAAGEGMLLVYGPYGLVVLAALGIYSALSWRVRYLAAAVILGPFTLIRPLIAVAGAVVAVAITRDAGVAVAAALAVVGVLLAEPLAGRLWYRA